MRDLNRHPLVVIWGVTQACRLACVHCRAKAIPRRDPDELTTEEGFRLMDQAAVLDKPLFVLTGGDPMERDDLGALARHGVARGLKVALSPSATEKVTLERLKALKEAGLHRVAISLDSHDEKKHDAFRGVEGSYRRTIEIAESARRISLPLQIGTTVTRNNMDGLDAIARLVDSLDVILWSVFFLVPTGRADPRLVIDADACEKVLNQLYEISHRVRFAIKTTEAPHYRRVAAQRSGRWMSHMDGINDAKGFVFISHRGEVYPSGFLPVSAGNVRRTSLGEIYRESSLFRSLRNPDQLKGKCGRCQYRRLCGGSRARAYAITGDPLEADPLCNYQPKEIPATGVRL